MDNPYNLNFTFEAQRDLETAVNWIKEESIEAAEAFFVRFRFQCQTSLTNTPHMGVRLRLMDGTELYALTIGSYRAFYVADDANRSVTVIRILHTSRDIQNILNTAS